MSALHDQLVKAMHKLHNASENVGLILDNIILSDDDVEYTKAFNYLAQPETNQFLSDLNSALIEFLNYSK
jgi:hypothetical protein